MYINKFAEFSSEMVTYAFEYWVMFNVLYSVLHCGGSVN